MFPVRNRREAHHGRAGKSAGAVAKKDPKMADHQRRADVRAQRSHKILTGSLKAVLLDDSSWLTCDSRCSSRQEERTHGTTPSTCAVKAATDQIHEVSHNRRTVFNGPRIRDSRQRDGDGATVAVGMEVGGRDTRREHVFDWGTQP